MFITSKLNLSATRRVGESGIDHIVTIWNFAYIVIFICCIYVVYCGLVSVNTRRYTEHRTIFVGLFRQVIKRYYIEGRAAVYYGLSHVIFGSIVLISCLIGFLRQSPEVFAHLMIGIFLAQVPSVFVSLLGGRIERGEKKKKIPKI